jgi:hypothetical protein
MIIQGPAAFMNQAIGSVRQDQTSAVTVRREIKNKQTHRLRVHLSLEPGGDPETIDYEVSAVTEVKPNSTTSSKLDLKIGNYVLHAAEHVIRKKLVGAGKLSLGELGLPGALMDSMSDTHFWYPLLCLYLPEEIKDGAFPVDQPLGTRVEMRGSGTFKGNEFTIEGTLDSGTDSVAKYKISWSVDRQGWPRRAEGEVTDSTGTIQFKLKED